MLLKNKNKLIFTNEKIAFPATLSDFQKK